MKSRLRHTEVKKNNNLWNKVTICFVFQDFWNSMRRIREQNQHNIETCNIQTVGPANRSFSNRKHVKTMKNKNLEQISTNEKLRRNKWE